MIERPCEAILQGISWSFGLASDKVRPTSGETRGVDADVPSLGWSGGRYIIRDTSGKPTPVIQKRELISGNFQLLDARDLRYEEL